MCNLRNPMSQQVLSTISPSNARLVLINVSRWLWEDTERLRGHLGLLHLYTSPRLPLFALDGSIRHEEQLLLDKRNSLTPGQMQEAKIDWIMFRDLAGLPLLHEHLIRAPFQLPFARSTSPLFGSNYLIQLRKFYARSRHVHDY